MNSYLDSDMLRQKRRTNERGGISPFMADAVFGPLFWGPLLDMIQPPQSLHVSMLEVMMVKHDDVGLMMRADAVGSIS